MEQTQLIVMTAEQMEAFVTKLIRKATTDNAGETDEAKAPRNFVYGIRGIRNLFNVSHTTAQRYKNTFLAPAVMQRGKKLIIDVEKAVSLYNANVR